jgi:DNA-binding GntR family transcriptional regulator
MSLQIDIYNKLKNAIIYGELSPGEKLSEIELAKNLNSSRTPIREAFRQLQTEGYLTVVPNKGACVSKLPLEEIEEIYNVIRLLEGYAAELAAKRINNSELNELKKLQKKLTLDAYKKRYRDYIEKNTEFHHLITRLSGNSHLERIISELRMRIFRYRLVSVTIPGYLGRYASDHEKIIDSIGKRDSIRAGKYIREHVDFVKEVLVNFLKDNRGF